MPFIAIIVTKFDHPLGDVIEPIRAHPNVAAIRLVRGVDGVMERWGELLTITDPTMPVYVQDDDAVVDVPAVLAAYNPTRMTCNMPADRRREYRDGIALVGWGAVFPAALPIHALAKYQQAGMPEDEILRREADRVVTCLSPLELIDVPFVSLPQAFAADRMGQEARHGRDLKEIRRRIYAVRGYK